MNLSPKLFPTLLMVQYLIAAGIYFWQGDWRHGLYWTAAAVIGFVITY